MTDTADIDPLTDNEFRNLERQISSGTISHAKPPNWLEILKLVKYTRACLTYAEEQEERADELEEAIDITVDDAISNQINLSHLTDYISKGENMEALKILHEALPDRVRQPTAVLDLIKCHKQATFQEKIKAQA